MNRVDNKGVTLVELIIVMIIIAIGAALVAPGVSSWIPHYRLRNAARDIASTMRVAQMRAISNNLTYQIAFNPGNKSYILQFQNSGGLVNDGDPQVLSSGFQLNTTRGDNTFQFRPDSTITGGAVNIINPKGSRKTIRLEGRRIRIE